MRLPPANESYFEGAVEPVVGEIGLRASAGHSWLARDLVAIGNEPPEPPTIGGLVYPGRTHLFKGEPESLKSWAALVLCADEINAGRNVLYLDFENGAAPMLERLRALGVNDETIKNQFMYLAPDEPIGAYIADVKSLIEETRPSLAVVDAFEGIAVLQDFDGDKSRDIERFYQTIGELLTWAGAALVVIDHVVKHADNRGKYAIGSQRKVGRVDVALDFTMVQSFARGRTGKAKIVVARDRPGHLPRPTAATLTLTSEDDGAVTWELAAESREQGESQTFLPTFLMERVSRYLEENGPSSRSAIEQAKLGNAEYVRQALEQLLTAGYVTEERGERRARINSSAQPFRDDRDDPTSSTSSDLVPTSSETKSGATSSTSSPPSRGRRRDEERPATRRPLTSSPKTKSNASPN